MDEAGLDYILRSEAVLLLGHLYDDHGEFGGGLTLCYPCKVAGKVLLIYIYSELFYLGAGWLLWGVCVEQALCKLVAIEDLLGFGGVGEDLIYSSVDVDIDV